MVISFGTKREPLSHRNIESPAVAPQGAVVGLGVARVLLWT